MIPRSILLSLLIGLLYWVTSADTTLAQRDLSVDSAQIHQAIVDEHPELSFTASARKLFARQLRRGDYEDARGLIIFMGRSSRPDAAGWLTGAEELVARTIIAPGSVISDIAGLGEFLRRRVAEPREHPGYIDQLYRALQRDLLEDFTNIARRFTSGDPSDEELTFFTLLTNHLTIRGLRGREEINRRATDFAATYPNSALATLACTYIKVPYKESDIGFAFQAGYTAGGYVATQSDLLGKMDGPSIGLEAYYKQGTFAGNVVFGTVALENAFSHGGEEWRVGDAPFINVTFDLGWEFRLARLALVPMGGISLAAMDAPGKSYEGTMTVPATGGYIGYDLSGMIAYRIFPSDIGPHLDVRMRGGWTHSGLGDYDEAIGGSLWYVTLGIALVQRPYRGGE